MNVLLFHIKLAIICNLTFCETWIGMGNFYNVNTIGELRMICNNKLNLPYKG